MPGQNQELDIDYPDLSKGRSTVAPLRSLTPDSPRIWRDSLNMVSRDGIVQPRHALTAISTSAKTLPPSIYDLTATTNGERPVWLYSGLTPIPQNFSTANGGINGTTPFRVYGSGSSSVCICLTNRQCYVFNDTAGAFINVTPTYTTGVIATTNGAPGIVGTGTAWLTRGISPFQHIQVGATWYEISAVVDDTHITLASNFAGTTGGGKAYVINRTWGMGNSVGSDRSAMIFALVYNNNLYVAGTFLGRADGIPTPTVIQVANFLSATPTTTYLTSSVALVAGLDIITIGSISGLAVLPDSRVVITGDQSTLFYSSNLVNTVWSATPAGFTIVEHKSGAIHTLGWLGSNLTLHFETGIVFGLLTGQSDPPLNFQDSQATVGCVCPMTLREWNRVQYFVGFDSNVYVFNGATAIPVGEDIKNTLSSYLIEDMKNNLFAAVNNKWSEYTLYMYSASSVTMAWTLTHDGSWWPHQFPAPIGAVSDEDALTTNRRYGLAGLYSLDGVTEKSMICGLSNASSDEIIYSGLGAGDFFLQTDYFDAGTALAYKTLTCVCLWFLPSTSTIGGATILVSADNGVSGATPATRLVLPVPGSETPVQFSFLDMLPASLLIRIKVSMLNGIAPTRLVVTVIPMGDAGLVQF